MGRFQALRCLLKLYGCPHLAVSARQNFLAVNSHGRIFQIRCVTSDEVTSPGRSATEHSALDVVENLDLSDYGSVAMPSFNFAAYADSSELLQKFIKLGVNLFEIEKKPNIEYLLTLKLEKIQKYLDFLTDNGVPEEKLGEFITLNPFIFKEDLNDLQVRINYLESKKFTKEMVSRILEKNPKWLSVPVKSIDEQLGFLQQNLDLSGNQVRQIVTTAPSLGTVNRKKIMVILFTLKEEMHLDEKETKRLVLAEPSLLRKDAYDLISTYDYLTQTMNVPRDLILKQAKVLSCRKFFFVERHLFLKSIGRAQYNHLLPGYVALKDLVEMKDEEFCEKIALTSVKCYDEFLKTL